MSYFLLGGGGWGLIRGEGKKEREGGDVVCQACPTVKAGSTNEASTPRRVVRNYVAHLHANKVARAAGTRIVRDFRPRLSPSRECLIDAQRAT